MLAAAAGLASPAALLGGDAPVRDDLLTGRLVDEYGQPLARWHVAADPVADWILEGPSASTDADGRFRFQVLPRRPHRIVAGPDGTWIRANATGPITGGWDVTIRVKPPQMPHARVRARFLSPDGEELRGVSAFLVPLEGTCVAAKIVTGPAERDDGLHRVATGVYEVFASHATCGTFDFGRREVSDAADVDLGALTFPRLGKVRVVAQAAADAAPAPIQITIARPRSDAARTGFPPAGGFYGTMYVGAAGAVATCPEIAVGAPVEGPLTPGSFVVRVEAAGVQGVQRVFEVRSGETTVLKIPVRAARERRVRLRFPGVVPTLAHVVVSDAAGDVAVDATIAGAVDPAFRLVPGTYRIDAEADDLRRFAGDLVVPADPEARLGAKLSPKPDAPVAPR